MADLTPYSTAKPYFGTMETWLPTEDAQRLASYALYEAIYRNVPDAFKVIQRGSEQNPIYIPSGKTIIEASNRFLAKRWDYAIDPRLGSDAEREQLGIMLRNLFVREQVYSKFGVQKKYGLIRGDAIWHITANESKEAGKRLSIHTRDPGSYFPIFDAVDDSKVVGCHLVDQFDDGSGKVILRRQTYRKNPETRIISYEIGWFETGGWDDREGSGQTLKKTAPPKDYVGGETSFDLPAEITSLPVYHVKNDLAPEAPFGTSELSGLERVIGAISQAISDEELALVLEGLGLYATTSSPPVDDDGNETTWGIGPGYVVEHDEDSDFKRISGVASVTPVLDHVGYLDKAMREASGTPDIAIGRVDTAIAESGISLTLQMGPLLAKNEEKELILLSVMDHMLYDIVTMWLPAFEGMTTEARAASIVDDPLPLDRKAFLAEISQMLADGIISIAYAQQLISEKLGYDFPDTMLAEIVVEQAKLAEARNTDPFMARVERELLGGST